MARRAGSQHAALKHLHSVVKTKLMPAQNNLSESIRRKAIDPLGVARHTAI
jgi:hypothetical protein